VEAPPKTWKRVIKYWVLAIPLLGLVELAAHFYFSHRAPTKAQWDDVRSLVASWYKPGQVIVVAPEWAEPMARWSFGDALMPTRDVARPDATRYREALEVSTLGSRSPELAGWQTVRETKQGRFTLRELSNPASPHVTYDFTDHIDATSADVRIVQGTAETPCSFTTTAPVESGGLGGTPTYPAARFSCPGQPSQVFVGITIVEDDQFRPRRCVWSQPPSGGAELVTRFKGVPLGTVVRGHTGMRWAIVRDGVSSPIVFRVMIGGQEVGKAVHQENGYWRPFEVPLGSWAGRTEDVEFRVSTSGGGSPVCFEADSR
jgi:hypothetical protein